MSMVQDAVSDTIESLITKKPKGIIKLLDVNKDDKVNKEDAVLILKWILVSLLSIVFTELAGWLITGITTGDFSNYEPFTNLVTEFGGIFILMVYFKSFLEKFNTDKKEVEKERDEFKESNSKKDATIEHNNNVHEIASKQLENIISVKQIEIDMLKLGFNPDLANARLAELYPEILQKNLEEKPPQ